MYPLKQHVREAPYLLTGEVIEILDGQTKEGQEYHRQRHSMNPREDTTTYGYTARIRVMEGFKGNFGAGDTITIESAYTGCDVLFKIGEQYVLFLHQEKNVLLTTHCSYSARMDNSPYVAQQMAVIRNESQSRRKR